MNSEWLMCENFLHFLSTAIAHTPLLYCWLNIIGNRTEAHSIFPRPLILIDWYIIHYRKRKYCHSRRKACIYRRNKNTFFLFRRKKYISFHTFQFEHDCFAYTNDDSYRVRSFNNEICGLFCLHPDIHSRASPCLPNGDKTRKHRIDDEKISKTILQQYQW